jgi:succinate dehydrogenase/fumarate reductase iron-sulfur protein
MNFDTDAALAAVKVGDNLAARNTRLREGDVIGVRILRSAANGKAADFETFEVPYRKWMRVLDVLNYVSEHFASDLAYRWFCGSKMCGSCAVRMNGREVLACWEAAEPSMTIEPLRNLPVVRDLVVDREPFDRKVLSFEPWVKRTKDYAGFPEPLSHKEMKHASKALDCIGCMACYSACPVIGLGGLTNFAGPGPLVQLAQTALDPRNDLGKVARALEKSGIFNCVSCYKCEEACPAKIPIVSEVIEPLKAKAAQVTPHIARHALAFHKVVTRRGRIDPTELIVRVQGVRILGLIPRAVRLLVRGKINPLVSIFGSRSGRPSSTGGLLGKHGKP